MKTVTSKDLQKIIAEVSFEVLRERREEIVKRAEKLLRERRSEPQKKDA